MVTDPKKRTRSEEGETDDAGDKDETGESDYTLPISKKLKQKQLNWNKYNKHEDKENTLFIPSDKTNPTPRGLYNESNTCYLNSLIQVLYHLHPFRDLVFSLQLKQESQKLSVLEALQWLFLDLYEGTDEEVVTTNRLTKAFGWTSINRGLQQDIHEFMQTLFGCLEMELSTSDFVRLSSLFSGKTQRTVSCEKVGYKSSRTEEIRGLSLPTITHLNIERSIEEIFRTEELDMTIESHGRQRAEIKSALTESPQVLLLTLNRLKYDVIEQAVVKVTDHYVYGDNLKLCGHVYRLHSAVIHEGTADSGHYYCYINPTCNNKWYMFNDQDVTLSDTHSAIRDNYGRRNDPAGPTAYLVTYIRDDCTDFFRPCQQTVPQKLRNRIENIRSEEKARLERIQTAHLYTTISLVSWAMLQSHSSYDVCDRLRLENLHKAGEGTVQEGIHNMRVLKSSSISDIIRDYDKTITEDNTRLWSFTERQVNDGWDTYRPDKLVKEWKKSVAVVSNMRCPYYIYMERLGVDYHPVKLVDDCLSIFIKLYGLDISSSEAAENEASHVGTNLKLSHHLVLPLDMSIGELKSQTMKLSSLEESKCDLILYQEHSSMWTERLSCDDDMTLSEALSGQMLRHGTILIMEVVMRDATTITSQTGPAADHMGRLGQTVHITWYNKNTSYLPSSEGDFTLELYLDMCISDIIQRLANHLQCAVRNLQIYQTKRDHGYPQLCDTPVYDSDNTETLLKLVYKQVQHSHLWRHSAVLFYEQLELSIEEMALRHRLTCEYISHTHSSSGTASSQTVTLYPLKHKPGDNNKIESTVDDLLVLAREQLNTTRELRLLGLSGKKIIRLYQSGTLISTILRDDLRLEVIPEDEEDIESEFSELLASVLNDSAHLVRRGVNTAPFLMAVDRGDTGVKIRQRIHERLKIPDTLKEKLEFRLIIHGDKSITLPDSKLTVKQWADLTYEDSSGSYEKSSYIKITDAH